MSTANRKARPARRNSLQRMLELERRYMMERMQSAGMATPTKTAGGRPIVPPPTRNVFATNPHPVIQAYRAVGHTQTEFPQGAKPHVLETTRGLPPLSIDTQISQPIQDVKVGAANPDDLLAKGHQTLPDKLASKIVSFYIPTKEDEEDRKSICQSPSWEAYGRRKKEKTEEKKDVKKELKKDTKKDTKELKKEKENDKAKKKQKEKEEKEKKEKMKEKEKKEKEREKEREEASKAAVKKKRLSKTPPTSSANAIDQANRLSRSGPSPFSEQPRSSSAVGSASATRDENAQRRPPSRSSSISSLFRRPFESRRNSTDEITPAETSFIGGIKLEMERHAAMQKTLDDQCKPSKEDEANIHPALRTGKPEVMAHVETVLATSGGKSPDPQRRAYPPITRLITTAKTRPHMTTSTSMPDAGAMQKWRAFVGMKSTAKQGPSEAKADATATATIAPSTLPTKAQHSPQATRANDPVSDGPKLAKSQTAPQLSLPHGVKDAQVNAMALEFEERTIQATAPQMQIPRKEVAKPEMIIQTKQRLSDVTLAKNSPPCSFVAPPEPPERSPKRASVQSLADLGAPSCSSTERPTSQTARRPGSSSTQRHSYAGSHSRDSLGSGIEHFGSSGATLAKSINRPESAKVTTWEDIKSSVAQAIADNVSLSPVRKSQSFLRDDSDFTVRRLSQAQVSSLSDDCSTDEFHSPSVPGTPDTSRPQSEKGAPPVFSDIEQRLMSQGEARTQSQPLNFQSAAKDPAPDVATHKIPRVVLDAPEAGRVTVVNAATSVLHMPQGRSVAQIRVPSEADGLPDMNFLPKLKHQPLKPAEKQQTPAARQLVIRASPSPSKEKMLTNQQPWPASYLEEARKATPLAPPPQALRSPGLPPKTSSRTPELSVRTHPSSSTIGHSVGSSGYATPSGDPVAKMFVECCGCKYYHDLPSNLYEVMANPDTAIPSRNTKVELSGLVTLTVRCPWCNHEMNTKCCAGYLAMVYLKQRLH